MSDGDVLVFALLGVGVVLALLSVHDLGMTPDLEKLCWAAFIFLAIGITMTVF